MPTPPCKAERAAFVAAQQEIANAELSFDSAEAALEAAIWESGAADIELVKDTAELVHSHGPVDAVFRAGIAKLLAEAKDHAAELRIKSAELAMIPAGKRRDAALAKFQDAQRKLQNCLTKHKEQNWSGSITITDDTPLSTTHKKGATGIFYESSSSLLSTTYEIFGPVPGETGRFFVKWTGSVIGMDKTWGKPRPGFQIFTAITNRSGKTTGLGIADIEYDEERGLSLSIDVPGIGPKVVQVTTISTDPKSKVVTSKELLTLLQPDSAFTDGLKEKDGVIEKTAVTKYKKDDFGDAHEVTKHCKLKFSD